MAPILGCVCVYECICVGGGDNLWLRDLGGSYSAPKVQKSQNICKFPRMVSKGKEGGGGRSISFGRRVGYTVNL